MIRISALRLLTPISLVCLLFSTAFADEMSIVTPFIAPGSSIVQISEADAAAGRVVNTRPAVMKCHLTSNTGSENIVFAEKTDIGGKTNVLSIDILQPVTGGYRKVFAKTYYDKILFAQDFKTIGLQAVPLSASKIGLLVITSSGAALGGDLEIFTWKDGLGFVNVVPNGFSGGHHFSWSTVNGVLKITISYKTKTTDPNAPPPTILEWNDQQGMIIAVK